MTENKRFIIDIGEPQHENAFFEYDEHFDDYEFVCWEDDFDSILNKFNELGNENEQLKLELDTHKHPLWSTREAERIVNELKQENKQLKQFQNNVAEVINNKMGDNVCNDYKMEVLKEIWKELNLDEVWFE